jgi:phospholipid/cholesterol/gamma-HCH transport system substrate-binding protein
MNRQESPQLWRTGVFLMGSIALLLGAVVLLGRSQTLFAHRVHLHTSFENTSGLVAGAPVRLGGVDVGVVDSIRFDNDLRQKKVHVGMAVERRYFDRIRADSFARLSSKGLLGDMIINITVGSAEAPALADGATLRSQESEGLTEIIDSVHDGIEQLRSLSASVQQRLEAVLTDDLARDLGRIAHSAAGVAEHIETGDGLAHALVYEPRLARKADRLLDDADQLAARANDAVHGIDRLLAAVEHGDGTLHGLIYRDEGGRLLADLDRTARAIEDVVVQVRGGKGLAHALIYDQDRGDLVANLTSASATLRRIADETEAGKGSVGALLKDPSVYEDLKTILGNIKRNRLLKAVIRYEIKRDGLRADNPR